MESPSVFGQIFIPFSAVDLNTLASSLPDKISKEEINQLPLARYEGKIHLIQRPDEVAAAVERIREHPVLGFDTETRPVFKKGQSFPPALIQIAGEGAVWLFQLNQLDGLSGIVDLLTNPKLLKVGVALRDDFVKLKEMQAFEEQGVVDIATMTQPLEIVNTGLRSLCALFLGIRISKAAQVSNWGRQQLTASQITYAATDAWASRQLFLELRARGVPYQAKTHH